MNPFYEALIERDAPRARDAARELHGLELFLSVTRFALLAYAPSQHAKHALLSCLSTWELREELGPRYDDALIECALYAAASRQPWSEPPIMNPPALSEEPESFEERLAAEQWLARRWQDDGFAHEYFLEASHDFEDLGHALIVSAAAWKLAPLLGEQGRYATLRTGVWEMVATRGERYEEKGMALEEEALAAQLVEVSEGDVVSAHTVFLLEAALQCGDDDALRRVRDFLSVAAHTDAAPLARRSLPAAPAAPPVYDLARDYGATLKAHAVAKRWRARFPSVDVDRFVAGVEWNRVHGPSYAEWSFA